MSEIEETSIEKSLCFLSVEFPGLGGGYELTISPFLAQAVGNCCGVDFYFTAKDGFWFFETEDEVGHPFPMGDSRSYRAQGHFHRDKATVMTIDWAASLIRRCLADFWGVRG